METDSRASLLLPARCAAWPAWLYDLMEILFQAVINMGAENKHIALQRPLAQVETACRPS